MYKMEYEYSTIGALIDVLQKLDYERVTLHLKDINERIAGQKYDPARDSTEVVNALYEVINLFCLNFSSLIVFLFLILS